MSKVIIPIGVLNDYLEFYKEYIRIFQDESITGKEGYSLEDLSTFLMKKEHDGVIKTSIETVVTIGTILRQGHKFESVSLSESFSIASGFQVIKTLMVAEEFLSEDYCSDIKTL